MASDRRGFGEAARSDEISASGYSWCVKICGILSRFLTSFPEVESSPGLVAQLVTSILEEDVLYNLARSLHLLPFESRKDTQTIFSHVLRYKPLNRESHEIPAVSYIVNDRPEIISALCRGYEHRESAMPCGIVLREALKHEDLAIILLYDQSNDSNPFKMEEVNEDAKQSGQGLFWQFFSWIDTGAFEVSTDAFTTFRVR